MKNEKGFTLIELMVTVFILCFVLLAMGAHIGLVMKTTLKDKQITAGSALLQDKMEGFKRVPYTSIATDANGDTKTAFGSTFTRTWTVTSVFNGVTVPNMKQVQVVVSWQGGTVAGSTVISE
jgi:prepilin-type N-terminal cleavage/methylation domain-containing protein